MVVFRYILCGAFGGLSVYGTNYPELGYHAVLFPEIVHVLFVVLHGFVYEPRLV